MEATRVIRDETSSSHPVKEAKRKKSKIAQEIRAVINEHLHLHPEQEEKLDQQDKFRFQDDLFASIKKKIDSLYDRILNAEATSIEVEI